MIKCKNCQSNIGQQTIFKCKNCHTYFCEECAKNTKNICPTCYHDIDYAD